MSTLNQTLETDNLVLFPSAKNYSLENSLQEDEGEFLNDPLEDLLTEFNDLDESLEQSLLNEDDLDNNTGFDSLEAFMNRHQSKESLTPDDKLVLAINDQMELIMEAKARLKFYLDELEMFLPSRR